MARQEVQRRKAKSRKETTKKSSGTRGNRKKPKNTKEIIDAITGRNTSIGKFSLLYPDATLGDMVRFCLTNQALWEIHLNQALWDRHAGKVLL
jgi:hypothetical protein